MRMIRITSKSWSCNDDTVPESMIRKIGIYKHVIKIADQKKIYYSKKLYIDDIGSGSEKASVKTITAITCENITSYRFHNNNFLTGSCRKSIFFVFFFLKTVNICDCFLLSVWLDWSGSQSSPSEGVWSGAEQQEEQEEEAEQSGKIKWEISAADCHPPLVLSSICVFFQILIIRLLP